MQAGGMQGGRHAGKTGVSVEGGVNVMSGRRIRTVWEWLTDTRNCERLTGHLNPVKILNLQKHP